jgi:DNA-binding XRE family transcriptional regulator
MNTATYDAKLHNLRNRLMSKHNLIPKKEQTSFEQFVQEFSQFVYDYRKDHGLSQHELAERMGISQSRLCRIEKNDWNPTLETFFNIFKNIGGELEIKYNFPEPSAKKPKKDSEQEYI